MAFYPFCPALLVGGAQVEEPGLAGADHGPDGCAGCGSGRPEFLVGAALQRDRRPPPRSVRRPDRDLRAPASGKHPRVLHNALCQATPGICLAGLDHQKHVIGLDGARKTLSARPGRGRARRQSGRANRRGYSRDDRVGCRTGPGRVLLPPALWDIRRRAVDALRCHPRGDRRDGHSHPWLHGLRRPYLFGDRHQPGAMGGVPVGRRLQSAADGGSQFPVWPGACPGIFGKHRLDRRRCR